MKYTAKSLSTFAFAAFCASALLPHTSRAADGQATTYHCDKLKTLVVSYHEAVGDKPDFVSLSVKNKHYTLPRASAASGIRFSDEKHYEWWSKGEEGTLTDVSKKRGASFACKEVAAGK